MPKMPTMPTMNKVRKLMRSVAVTGSLLAVTVAIASTATAQDKIIPVKGTQASGKIEEITRDQVTVSVKGKNQVYKTNEIAKIIFDDEPINVENARGFIANRQFNMAETELKKIDTSKVKDERVAQDIQYYKAYVSAKMALSGMGDPRAAAKELATAHAAAPQSYHSYEAAQVLGELALALNLPDAATRYFGELAAAPFPELKALAAFRMGEVAMNANNLADARKRFEQIMSVQATDTQMIRLKSMAEVGLVTCDARDGKAPEALAKLQELVQKNDSSDQELFARIYNAQGACYTAMNQPQQALLAYLRTDLLFSSTPELHAEALYRLTQLWPKVGDPQRAAATRQRLTSTYPSSVWSNNL